MFTQLWSISRNTFAEAVRQPIYFLLILAGILLTVLAPFLAAYSMEPGREGDNKLLIDMGMSNILVVGLIIGALTATGVLSDEIDRRTVLTIVSKPVPRVILMLGKLLGVVAALTLAIWILSLGLLFALRHGVMSTASQDLDKPVLLFGVGFTLIAILVATVGNYLYRWPWTSTCAVGVAVAGTLGYGLVLVISPEWAFQSPMVEFEDKEGELGQIMLGLLLVWQSVLIMAAIALAISTRLGQFPTLILAMAIFVLSLIAPAMIRPIDRAIGVDSEAHLLAHGEGWGSLHRIEEAWFNHDLKYMVRSGLITQDRYTWEHFSLLTEPLDLDEETAQGYFREYVRERALPEPVVDALADLATLPLELKVLFTAGSLAYMTLPNLTLLWPAEAITQGNPFSGGYVVMCTLYSLTYIMAVFAIGVALFQTREVG